MDMIDNPNINDLLDQASRCGLQLDPASAKINESGLDFQAMFADTADGVPWVIRRPRRLDVIDSADYESKVLHLIRNKLPVQVPDWKVHTADLIAYPMLEGVPAASINAQTKSYDWVINPQSLSAVFVQSLAAAMAALHRINHEEAASAGIRVLQPDEARRTLSIRMDRVKANFGVSHALWQRWQAWTSDDSFWPEHSSLVHGDLHPGHILINPDEKVTGLLDWTEAEVADPAADFAIYCACFGEPALEDLIEHYRTAGGRVWPRMQEHIVETLAAYPVLIALFALKSGLPDYMEMARGALGVDENGEDLPAQ
ncbi:macrolide 2'-phosphotransferase [Paenibacillus sepulcri]